MHLWLIMYFCQIMQKKKYFKIIRTYHIKHILYLQTNISKHQKKDDIASKSQPQLSVKIT